MKKEEVTPENERIELGRRGEHRARQIIFDLVPFLDTYGAGSVQLLHQRKGDAVPYLPELVQVEGNTLIWTPTADDTAVEGIGQTELRWYVGGALAKSIIQKTLTRPSLGDPGEEPEEIKSALDLLAERMVRLAIPAGGSSGQVLVKVSPADYDAAWQSLPIPVSASIDNDGLITFSGSDGAALFTLQLPIYDGEVI